MAVTFKSLKVKDETYDMLVRARDKLREIKKEKKISFDEVIMSLSEKEVPNGKESKKRKQTPDYGPIWGFSAEEKIF